MKRIALLAVSMILAVAGCSYSGWVPETQTPTRTVPPPTATASATPSRTPTTTPTPTPLGPAAFPPAPLTAGQLSDVADCNIKDLAEQRYPKELDQAHLEETYSPQTNCEWAVLAYAYSVRNEGQEPPAAGIHAYQHSLAGNYGYALATDNFYRYFNSVQLVNNPAIAAQEITRVRIVYAWSGMGDPSSVRFSLTIAQANTKPLIVSDSPLIKRGIRIDKAPVQALGTALTDLLPVDSKFQLLNCTDSEPTWQVQLTFADGSKLDMQTDSNMIYMGGPWQTEIDGQSYLQVSPAFAFKMGELAQALELPLGQPYAMACFSAPVFEKAYSTQVPERTPTPNATLNVIFTRAAGTLETKLTQQAASTP